MNKQELENLVKQYNSALLPGDKRLIDTLKGAAKDGAEKEAIREAEEDE